MKKVSVYFVATTLLFSAVLVGLLLFSKNDADSAHQKAEFGLLHWQVGVSQHYKVSMDSSMAFNSAQTGLAQDLSVKLDAGLQLFVLEADNENALAGIQLSNVSLSISGQSDPETNTALQQPFRVQFSFGGVPEKFEFPAELTLQERSILKNVMLTFIVSSNKNQETQWAVSERNASGAYEALYTQSSETEFKKVKRQFVASSSAPILRGAQITSTESIYFDTRYNWISSMVVEEHIFSANHNNTGVKIKNYAKIQLAKNQTQTLSKAVWQFKAAVPNIVASQNPSAAAKLSAKEVKQALKTTVPILDNAAENRTQHIHALRDLLRMHASAPAELILVLDTEELSDRTRADLYLALELAATTEAQAALTSVIQDPAKLGRDAMRATVALSGINNPSPETLAVLWEVAQQDQSQLSNTAAYTLGSIGSRMKAGQHPDYIQLRDELLSNAYGNSHAHDRATYLYALGNTRDTEIASDVSRFLGDDHPTVRRAAALSLGLMGTPESSVALVSQFKQENNSQVRGSIAESLSKTQLTGDQANTAMLTISQSITSETNESSRYAMAKFIGQNLAEHPQYKPLLQSMIRTEPSKRVRHVIGEALAAM